MLIKHYERNRHGHDYVVGDIHGCFPVLDTMLNAIGFNKTRDRLFSVGDMVDRGPNSQEVLTYLAQPWFHAVTGNHEQLAVEYFFFEGADRVAKFADIHFSYIANGGDWFVRLDGDRQAKIVKAFRELPIGIEVELPDRRVGIVHAEVPDDDWAEFKKKCNDRRTIPDHLEHYALWGRQIIRAHRGQGLPADFAGVANIDAVYVGHSVVPDATQLGNIHYIDTGCTFGKKMTIINLHTGHKHVGERHG